MKVTQKFVFKKDCKHSVVYEPAVDTAENPAMCSSVYLSRLVLPRPTPASIELTLECGETQAAK